LLSKVAGGAGLNASTLTGEERYIRVGKEVELAERDYKLSVSQLDRSRLSLEETFSQHLPYLQQCEQDRLKALESVLKLYHSLIKTLPLRLLESLEKVEQTLELVRVEKDLKLLIEKRRTGRFGPRPVGFVSHYSEEYETSFGIDLRRYDETNQERDSKGGRETVPKVLRVLLNEIESRMQQMGDEDDEKRKSWLYETPLSTQHSLRSLLNSPETLNSLSSSSDLERFDLPILCSVVKLWLLELEVPVISFTCYDELRKLFKGERRVVPLRQGLVNILAKLPTVHLEVSSEPLTLLP
jgi:hypothetical protein